MSDHLMKATSRGQASGRIEVVFGIILMVSSLSSNLN